MEVTNITSITHFHTCIYTRKHTFTFSMHEMMMIEHASLLQTYTQPLHLISVQLPVSAYCVKCCVILNTPPEKPLEHEARNR